MSVFITYCVPGAVEILIIFCAETSYSVSSKTELETLS